MTYGSKELFYFMIPEGCGFIIEGRHGSRNRTLSCHIFTGKYKAEQTDWKWDRAISSQNPPQCHILFSKFSN